MGGIILGNGRRGALNEELNTNQRQCGAGRRQPKWQVDTVHHQQRADGRADGPADVEKGIVEGEDPRFLFRRQNIGKPRLQHGREDGIGAVDQSKEKHHQAYAIDQRNRDKAADKGQHGDKHIALFIKLIGQNAKPHAKDDADGEGDGERIANFIHLKLVLAGEENGHKGSVAPRPIVSSSEDASSAMVERLMVGIMLFA